MSPALDSSLLKVDADGPAALVPAVLDGRSMLLGFVPNMEEHARRQVLGVGAVHSRRALHALWALPHGITWPASAVDEVDEATLHAEGYGLVHMDEAVIVRLYQPAGKVEVVAITARRLEQAVAAVAAIPPIFRRFAISSLPDEAAIEAARTLGVGVVILNGDQSELRAEASKALIGAPGVYRWWMAESAYGSWLQTSVH